MHAEFGGAVPELASRDHVRENPPLLSILFQQACRTPPICTAWRLRLGT